MLLSAHLSYAGAVLGTAPRQPHAEQLPPQRLSFRPHTLLEKAAHAGGWLTFRKSAFQNCA